MGKARKSCFELRAAMDDFFIKQADLARMCGVKPRQVLRWCEGDAEVPAYVWCILSALRGTEIDDLIQNRWHQWKVANSHIYRNGRSHRALAKRFHPDISGRDTTVEMQMINTHRKR